jgi:hypothetical protein
MALDFFLQEEQKKIYPIQATDKKNKIYIFTEKISAPEYGDTLRIIGFEMALKFTDY